MGGKFDAFFTFLRFFFVFLREFGILGVNPPCVQRKYSGYYSGLWTQRFPVQVPSGCQYSMRLDRLHRAYPSLHPFGVVHWVPVGER